jgi:hypothetical protein
MLEKMQASGTHADMMKLVDISDLGSDEHGSWGFKSLYPYATWHTYVCVPHDFAACHALGKVWYAHAKHCSTGV